MQSQVVQHQSLQVSEVVLYPGESLAEIENVAAEAQNPAADAMCFHNRFTDFMEMYADAETVANYLKDHPEWFKRCARPMAADPITTNGYAVTIGKFGSFGYEVEAKVGLELLPPEAGIYRINTIAVPDYTPPGYSVDFRAALQLIEVADKDIPIDEVSALTRVEWELDLAVYICFPKFIYKLPQSLLQKTGDRILCEIVRQVSRRLTCKVQQDFHANLGIPFNPKWRQQIRRDAETLV